MNSLTCSSITLQNVLQLLEQADIEPDIVSYGLLALGCRSADDAKNYVYGMQNEGEEFVLISINFSSAFVDMWFKYLFRYSRIDINILGAMLTNACSFADYDYVLEVLHISRMYNLKPSPRFLDIVYTFNDNAFRKINNTNLTKHDRNEFFRFSREFQQWQKDMNLKGLKKEAAIKFVKEKIQKQFREAHPKGRGRVKNTIKREFDRKKQSIHELKRASQENAGKPLSPRTEKRKSVEKNGKSASHPAGKNW